MTKKTLLIALSATLLICACSDDDKDNDKGFLTCEGQKINPATAHLISCSMCETNYCDLDGNLLNGCEGKKHGDKCEKIDSPTTEPASCDAPNTMCDFGCVNLSSLLMKDCSTCKDGYENADNNWHNGCEVLTHTDTCDSPKTQCDFGCVDLSDIHMKDCSTCDDNYLNHDSNWANGCEDKSEAQTETCNSPKTSCDFGCIDLLEHHMKDCSTCEDNYQNADNNWKNGCEANASGPSDETCDVPKTKCDFGCVSLSEFHMTDCNTCTDGYLNTDQSWDNGCEDVANNDAQITLGSDYFNEKCELKDLGIPVDYVLDESLYITCALTIEPGVTIAAKKQGINIEVRDNGSIKAVGTEEKPITITSGGDAPMGRIVFWDSANTGVTNEFSYVNIKNMANDADEAIAIHNGIKVSMNHVILDTVDGDGIWTDEKFVKFENNTIKNCNGYPIVADDLAVADSLGDNNSYSDNAQNLIKIKNNDSDDNPDITFKVQPIPYYFTSGLRLYKDNGKYTFPAGLQLFFKDDEPFELGSGSLTVSGTEENPVVIAPIADVNWAGMKLRSGKNKIEHLKLIKVNDGLQISDCEVSIDGLIVEETEDDGIGIDNNVKLIKFDNVNVSNTKEYPLSVSRSHLPILGSNNIFASSESNFNYIELKNVNDTVESELTIHKQNIPYYVNGEIGLYSDKVVAVNIDAGTHIVSKYIRVDEKIKFNANGTTDEHVVFEALPEDTWKGIRINTPNDVKLSYLDIKDVAENEYALEISESSKKVTIEHVSLSNTDGTCLRNDSTTVTGVDTIIYQCKTNIYSE